MTCINNLKILTHTYHNVASLGEIKYWTSLNKLTYANSWYNVVVPAASRMAIPIPDLHLLNSLPNALPVLTSFAVKHCHFIATINRSSHSRPVLAYWILLCALTSSTYFTLQSSLFLIKRLFTSINWLSFYFDRKCVEGWLN